MMVMACGDESATTIPMVKLLGTCQCASLA
jgi:hypothetical protein